MVGEVGGEWGESVLGLCKYLNKDELFFVLNVIVRLRKMRIESYFLYLVVFIGIV